MEKGGGAVKQEVTDLVRSGGLVSIFDPVQLIILESDGTVTKVQISAGPRQGQERGQSTAGC